MRFRSIVPTVVALCLLVCSFLTGPALLAQIPDTGKPTIRPAQQDNWVPREIKTSDLDPAFLRQWDFRLNPNLQRPNAGTQKRIRVIYLVPSDKAVQMNYQSSITSAILDLQAFYQNEVGNGNRFTLHSPIVEVYQTPHNSSWYSTNPRAAHAGWFWENTLFDGFSLTGGGFNDPNNRWVFYVDADPACGQFAGATQGIALMGANDLRGLSGQQYIPTCESPDNAPVGRWIGGFGHELAHTFNVPHPPGCDQGNCTGGPFARDSLMWLGFRSYPNTYLLPADEQLLLASGFFSNDFPVTVSGRITTGDGRAVFGTLVSLAGPGGSVRYAMTNPSGYYRFQNVTAGQTYTLNAQHKWFEFTTRQISPANDLTAIDFIGQ